MSTHTVVERRIGPGVLFLSERVPQLSITEIEQVDVVLLLKTRRHAAS